MEQLRLFGSHISQFLDCADFRRDYECAILINVGCKTFQLVTVDICFTRAHALDFFIRETEYFTAVMLNFHLLDSFAVLNLTINTLTLNAKLGNTLYNIFQH